MLFSLMLTQINDELIKEVKVTACPDSGFCELVIYFNDGTIEKYPRVNFRLGLKLACLKFGAPNKSQYYLNHIKGKSEEELCAWMR